ncbi:MAG: putative transrane bacteriophage adsorption protein [Verrucomicrobiota bacterium]|jgi:adsorption protein B
MDKIHHIFLILGYVAGIGFLVNGLDDLIFDSQFLFYLWRQRKVPHVTLKDLQLAPEQWIALYVPAWMEGGVVNKMADYAARVVLYEKYDIFIGVYPNDPETIACVDEICAQNPRIHKVMVPHGGPTSKADCLNWIHKAARLNEIPGVREYAVAALHDSEDVLHPLTLKVYNYYVPRMYDMGQMPVFALEMPVLKYWVSNTYIDDFAELHTKDMFIRQSIGGVVPSAGVGTAFSRHLLEQLGAENGGDSFRVGNITEDYEVGIRAKRAGFRVGVISFPVERIVRRPQADGSMGEPETITEIVAVRENFPTEFSVAVRQRSRWILGISFQTWEQTGWSGTWAVRYTLLRDRRAPLTHFINMLGYLVFVFALGRWVFQFTPWAESIYIPPLLVAGSLLWKIAILDTALLIYRMVQKFISVAAIYNVKQAAFSVPRLLVGNFINFFATWRAVRMYAANRFFGTPIVWLKTMHVFPGTAELQEYERSIEDLLVAEGLVTRQQIVTALEHQKNASVPLALLRLGLIEEHQFTDVWAKHSHLPVMAVAPSEVSRNLFKEYSEKRSLENEAVPIGEQNGEYFLAFREPPAPGQTEKLRANFGGKKLNPVLMRPSNLRFVRDRLYPRLVLPPSRLDAALGHFQMAAKAEAPAFLDLLVSQHATRRSLPDVLVDRGQLDETTARRLWSDALGCGSWDSKEISLDRDGYRKFGAGFWWLHRMLPATGGRIVTATPPHQQTVSWITGKLGGKPAFLAELPDKLELAARVSGVGIDPDQALVDRLVADGALKKAAAPDVKELRQLITDPIPKWLALQKIVTDEQLHQAFIGVSGLPAADAWNKDDVRRLLPILPPGFALENDCYPLAENNGAIRIGLAQLPLASALAELYDRLGGYPICFQALTFADAAKLRELAARA